MISHSLRKSKKYRRSHKSLIYQANRRSMKILCVCIYTNNKHKQIATDSTWWNQHRICSRSAASIWHPTWCHKSLAGSIWSFTSRSVEFLPNKKVCGNVSSAHPPAATCRCVEFTCDALMRLVFFIIVDDSFNFDPLNLTCVMRCIPGGASIDETRDTTLAARTQLQYTF